MKTIGILLATLAMCSQVQAGGYGGPFRATCNHGGYQQQTYGHQQNYQPQYHAGDDIQATAKQEKIVKGLRDEVKGLRNDIAALRGEHANLAKTLKDGLLGLSGTFQGTFSGGAGPSPNPQPQPPQPVPNPQPNPQPNPVDPDSEPGPVLTPFMQTLLTQNCAACHDGVKERAFTPDAQGRLPAGLSSEIWARLLSDEQGFKMPPSGSNQEMRDEASRWIGGDVVQQIRQSVLSRKKGK